MNFEDEPQEYYCIRRRTPRSRGLSWGGTIFFVIDLICIYNFMLIYLPTISLPDEVMISSGIIIGLFFILAIIMWVASSNAQNGTISFYENKISCICERSFIDLAPDQISSVQRDGYVVSIYFSGRKLVFKSDDADKIVDRVQDFISAYKYSGKQKISNPVSSGSASISADRIREYKELVNDGIITQEQFDQIINKLTKEQ